MRGRKGVEQGEEAGERGREGLTERRKKIGR
jgi:hypothetical protein